jgi:hypothetical protein
MLFEFLSLVWIQKGNNIWIWIWNFVLKQLTKACLAQLANWPNRPTRARLSRPGSGLGRSPDPVQPPSFSPLLLSISLATPDRRRRHLASPANSGGLCRRHLGRNTRLCALYRLYRRESLSASSPRRSGWSPRSGSAAFEHSDATPRLWSLLSTLRVLKCLRPASARRWKRQMWCSWCITVKSPLGRAWSAARALPRHAGQVCTWAPGKCDLPLVSLSSLPSHALWPIGQEQWA